MTKTLIFFLLLIQSNLMLAVVLNPSQINEFMDKNFIDSLINEALDFSDQQVLLNAFKAFDSQTQLMGIKELAKKIKQVGNHELAKEVINHGIHFAKKNDQNEAYGFLLVLKAETHHELSEYNDGIEAAHQALKIGEEERNQKLVLNCNNVLGNMNLEMRRFDLSKKYYSKAIEIANELSLLSTMGKVLNNLGLLFENINQYDSARYTYERALEINKSIQDSMVISVLSNNIAILYQRENDHEVALDYALQSVKIDQKRKDDIGLTYSLHTTSKSYRAIEKLDSAIFYAKWNMDMAFKVNSPKRIIKAAEVLYQLHKDHGNFKDAVQVLEVMQQNKDSVLNAEQLKQINELQTKYETEKKEQQIASLELKNANEKLKRNAYAVSFFSALVIGGFLAFGLWYRIRKNQQLSIKEREVAEERLQRTQADLNSYTLQLIDRSSRIEELNKELENAKLELSRMSPSYDGVLDDLMQSTILTEEEWSQFKKLFNQAHPGFLVSLRSSFQDLTDTEERLFVLSKLNLTTKEVAAMLGISVESVNKSRYRLRKKLQVNTEEMNELVASF
ncbi:MAG: tetratricopeptide repeat protein [Cyclobacteriaceae bacterium]